MHHLGTKTLQTPRLILRRLTPADAESMFRNWAGDPAVTEYLTWPPHASPESSGGFIHYLLEQYEKPDTYTWGIELKSLGQVIGTISVVRLEEDIEGVDLGYCLGRRWWGQGVMPEAAKAVIDYLFGEVGARRISARHASANPKSGRVMQKVGMTYEGTLRQAARCNQGITDIAVYSILKEEWMPAGSEERK